MAKALSAVTAPLLLTGCFLTPGAFDSSLDLRRDGTFAFAYKGEVVFAVPDDMMRGKPQPWSDDNAYCVEPAKTAKKGAASPMPTPRPCTASEIAEQRKTWEENEAVAEKGRAEDAKKFAAAFGYSPGDDEANRRLAAQIAKIDGFRSAVYRGEGVFDVDYAKAGRLDHDFVFPALLQANVMFPFVLARLQNDGAVRVAAPGFVANGALGTLANFKEAGLTRGKEGMPANRTKGRFVITTDGEVLTNNTEDGPAVGPRGRVLTWTVDQRSAVPPEALIRVR